jgi:hypothetical protein
VTLLRPAGAGAEQAADVEAGPAAADDEAAASRAEWAAAVCAEAAEVLAAAMAGSHIT